MLRKLTKSLIVVILLVVCSSPGTTFAIYGVDCNIDKINPACQPPTLGDLQTMLISLIGTAYALVGVLFMGILVYNGAIYMLGTLDEAKFILGASIEDAKKRMTQWLIGFLLVIISYPVVNTLLKGIASDNECFSKLNNPTVQFIFPTVCNKTGSPASAPTSTPTAAP